MRRKNLDTFFLNSSSDEDEGATRDAEGLAPPPLSAKPQVSTRSPAAAAAESPAPAPPPSPLRNDQLRLLRQRAAVGGAAPMPPQLEQPLSPSVATPSTRPEVGANERRRSVPVRRTGIWIVYAIGSRKGQWRLVYPVSEEKDSFSAMETP